jgi:hypothetical protein
VSLILATTVAAREPVPLWITFTEEELQRAKRIALQAMNSPEVWARFPKRGHQRLGSGAERDYRIVEGA